MTKENIKKEDLIKKINDSVVALRDIRFGVAGSKHRNVKEVKNLKREIARVKTSLNSAN